MFINYAYQVSIFNCPCSLQHFHLWSPLPSMFWHLFFSPISIALFSSLFVPCSSIISPYGYGSSSISLFLAAPGSLLHSLCCLLPDDDFLALCSIIFLDQAPCTLASQLEGHSPCSLITPNRGSKPS